MPPYGINSVFSQPPSQGAELGLSLVPRSFDELARCLIKAEQPRIRRKRHGHRSTSRPHLSLSLMAEIPIPRKRLKTEVDFPAEPSSDDSGRRVSKRQQELKELRTLACGLLSPEEPPRRPEGRIWRCRRIWSITERPAP